MDLICVDGAMAVILPLLAAHIPFSWLPPSSPPLSSLTSPLRLRLFPSLALSRPSFLVVADPNVKSVRIWILPPLQISSAPSLSLGPYYVISFISFLPVKVFFLPIRMILAVSADQLKYRCPLVPAAPICCAGGCFHAPLVFSTLFSLLLSGNLFACESVFLCVFACVELKTVTLLPLNPILSFFFPTQTVFFVHR